MFRELKVVSAQLWRKTPRGQHIELGIAENNLFIQLAALGLSHQLFGARLLPIGTLYDPFIARGLDALNYACYQDARFMLVATPSGVTLAPEGGAHQYPHAADRHRPARPAVLRAGLCRRAGGADAPWPRLHAAGQGRLGLSAPLDPQPAAAAAHADARAGGRHRGRRLLVRPARARRRRRHRRHGRRHAGSDRSPRERGARLRRRRAAGADLARPPACRLARPPSASAAARRAGSTAARARSSACWPRCRATPGWSPCSTAIRWRSHWLGSVRGQRIVPLGIEAFGQSGDIPDLYRDYGSMRRRSSTRWREPSVDVTSRARPRCRMWRISPAGHCSRDTKGYLIP